MILITDLNTYLNQCSLVENIGTAVSTGSFSSKVTMSLQLCLYSNERLRCGEKPIIQYSKRRSTALI